MSLWNEFISEKCLVLPYHPQQLAASENPKSSQISQNVVRDSHNSNRMAQNSVYVNLVSFTVVNKLNMDMSKFHDLVKLKCFWFSCRNEIMKLGISTCKMSFFLHAWRKPNLHTYYFGGYCRLARTTFQLICDNFRFSEAASCHRWRGKSKHFSEMGSEKIHTPPPRQMGFWKFLQEWGSKTLEIQAGGGLNW